MTVGSMQYDGYYALWLQSPQNFERQVRLRREQRQRADSDIAEAGLMSTWSDQLFELVLQKTILFAMRMTNYPSNVHRALLNMKHKGHTVKAFLQQHMNDHHNSFAADKALFVLLTRLAAGLNYKWMGMFFWMAPTRMSGILKETLKVFDEIFQKTNWPGSNAKWRGLEQACWAKLRVPNVLGQVDIKIVRISSTESDDFNEELKFTCKKVLVVYNIAGDIMTREIFPGKHSDKDVLEKSQFLKDLLNPTNPLCLPGKMKFRDGSGEAQPVFLIDRSLGDGGSVYLMVVNNLQRINTIRMDIERKFGSLTQKNRFLFEYTWTMKESNIEAMIHVAIAMMNFENNMQKSDDANHMHDGECEHDPTHVCCLWCSHMAYGFENPALVTKHVADEAGLEDLKKYWARNLDMMIVAKRQLIAGRKLLAEEEEDNQQNNQQDQEEEDE